LDRLRTDKAARPRGFAIPGNTDAGDLDSQGGKTLGLVDTLAGVAGIAVQHEQGRERPRAIRPRRETVDLILIAPGLDLKGKRMHRRRGWSCHLDGRPGTSCNQGQRDERNRQPGAMEGPRASESCLWPRLADSAAPRSRGQE